MGSPYESVDQLQTYLRVLETHPYDIELRLRIVRHYMDLGRVADAQHHYELAARLATSPLPCFESYIPEEGEKREAKNIILQPCASSASLIHFSDSVSNPVLAESIAEYCGGHIEANPNSYPVWGVSPAKNQSGYKKWARIEPGDLATFIRRKRVFYIGRVLATLKSTVLSQRLWKQPKWELIYIMDFGVHCDFALAPLTKALGYHSDLVLGFRVVDATPSARSILSRYFQHPHEREA